MFAMKELDASFSSDEAIKNSEVKVLESDLTLLGVTALEDLLQEDCK